MGLVAGVVISSVLIGLGVARSLTRSVRVLSVAAESVHKNHDFTIRAEKTSSDELIGVQGSPADLGGYYYVDKAKTDAVMRPSATFNDALASF
jgi:monomeric isocitrate dehydrogenase